MNKRFLEIFDITLIHHFSLDAVSSFPVPIPVLIAHGILINFFAVQLQHCVKFRKFEDQHFQVDICALYILVHEKLELGK